MAANQVDFKILPSDQFSVYSPQTRSDKVITYFTLLSKLRGDILSVGQDDDPNDIVSAFYSSVGGTQTLHLVKADGSEITASVPEPTVGTVTSVDLTASTGISVSGGPITTSGSITVTNTAPDQVVVLTGAGTTSISGTYPSFTITSNDQYVGTVTSVGLTMPAAFSVANSPVTNSGTLAVTAIGLSSQYIRGDGQLANFPTPGGGGSSVNYYLNGSVNQGTFGGVTYYELSKTPIAGAGTNFTRTNASGDGYVASFITDANDPDQINIPGGNFNLEFYFNSSSSGGSPAFYGELYKVSTSNVFTLIASGSANPEVISGGTFVDQYYTSIAVPQTALLATDRLAIRVYVIVDGRNITLHTEDANFSEVITTFSTGLNSLNGLSDQVQYFAVGTSGTDFAISSSVDTHTFNLPTASAANRGALSSADWTTFNGKASDAFKTIAVAGQSDIVADNATDTLTIVAGTNVTITTNATTDTITINSADQFVGTVTSVATTAPITGGTITTTGTIGITQSGAAADGYLSSTDWNTFNSKEPALTKGNLTEATSSVLTITGGTGAVIGSGTTIQVSQATTTTSGFLSSTDWNTFNNKQGTITLTTTGSTGAATFISNTLNIPNYADQFVGTVTSVAALTIGTTGTDLSSTVANSTTTPVITLNVPTASATNRGALSSTDWTTFNSKEPALTKGNLTEATSAVLTITGGTGAVIGAGTSIQVAQSGVSTSGFLSSTDWNTFNGKQGALTFSAPLVNTSGTVSIPAATSLVDGYLSATDFATFNGKQNAITLTTTGTTGAATLIGATLNIPNYADQFVGTVTSVGLTASTGISVSGSPITTSGSITVTNTAPDQVVSLTGAGTTTITGTYPNFTISSDDQYDGTVTSVNLTAGDRIEVSGGPITTSGSITVTHGTSSGADVTTAQSFRLRVIADGGTFEAFNDVAIAIGSLEDIATPQDTDNSGGTVLQNIVLDEFGHLLGVGSITLDTDDIIEGPTNLYFTNARARSALSAGTGITYDTSTGIITNSAPDQVVSLTGAGTTTISGTYPSFTVTSNDQFVGTVTSVNLTASTGISVSGGPITSSGSITVTNTAPDQTVVLTAGTGISVSGTYPSFTVTNSSPSSGGTVTSVAALTIGTTGTDLSSTVVNGTTTPVITLQVPTASAANRGALSSTDWTTFNGKQSAITLTTTGSTGAATFISNTLNIPNYTDQFVGTVTSVATTAPITGGTFTTTGTIGITQSGVSTDGYLSSTDWGTFNSKQPQLNGTGFVKASGTTISYDNSTYYLASNPSGFTTNTGTVTSVNLTAGARIEVAGGPITTSGSITVTHGVADGADFVTAEEFRDRVIADGGIFEALGEVAIAIGSLSDAASPSSTDYSDGYVLQNIAIDEFGHVLGVGVTDLDDRYAQLGLGTTNFLAKWSSPSELVTSIASDNGTGIGIGISSASYKLEVSGDIKVSSGSIGVGVNPNTTDGRIDASNDIVAFSSSDLRLKENIKPIENALDKVKSLTGVEFDWKPELKHAHGYEGHDTGVIAQEVQEVMPTAIRTNDTGYLAVRYEKLIGLLIEANKELAARVEQLESKLK